MRPVQGSHQETVYADKLNLRVHSGSREKKRRREEKGGVDPTSCSTHHPPPTETLVSSSSAACPESIPPRLTDPSRYAVFRNFSSYRAERWGGGIGGWGGTMTMYAIVRSLSNILGRRGGVVRNPNFFELARRICVLVDEGCMTRACSDTICTILDPNFL